MLNQLTENYENNNVKRSEESLKKSPIDAVHEMINLFSPSPKNTSRTLYWSSPPPRRGRSWLWIHFEWRYLKVRKMHKKVLQRHELPQRPKIRLFSSLLVNSQLKNDATRRMLWQIGASSYNPESESKMASNSSVEVLLYWIAIDSNYSGNFEQVKTLRW